ncbi:MAG: NAD-dependent epimerase/dehydratase family protein [Sorangiineae bacterium]|nr:NAD-dependent epimerase/dehydratase family protein [Polyangiaceae bacterium]MEB2321022.1 NAD-dependent epimerase/dehydratase family protein [Sorangiineae bacterium]
MARYWVGGATGFLGAHLVRELVACGHEVVGVSRSGGELDGLRVARVDVLDEGAVAASARGADGAFLATGRVSRAREDAESLHELHVLGTRRALAGLRAAGVRRVVVASTSGTVAVGRDPEVVFDETAEPPTELIASWPYYRTKLFGEREALEANQPPAFEVVVVNPSLLLGPGDERESSTGDVRRFLDGSLPAIPAGGIAFVDARDAAAGMRLAFERGRPGERYLLNAKNMTLAAFFQRLARISGVRAPRLRMPASPALAVGAHRLFARAVRAIGGTPPVDEVSVEMGQYYFYCSSAKAEEELGWRTRDPGETLRDTIDDLTRSRRAFPGGARVAGALDEAR